MERFKLVIPGTFPVYFDNECQDFVIKSPTGRRLETTSTYSEAASIASSHGEDYDPVFEQMVRDCEED